MRGAVRGVREWIVVAVGFGALASAFTYPLSLHLGSLSRSESADGKFSIWNVAWVAHALLTHPQRILDANIFYPRPRTLVYSEANLAAGALAVPAYWLTRNPYVAHNFVLVLLRVPVRALVVAGTRRLWRSRPYWTAIAVAALAAVLLTLPLAVQYFALQRETGFVRELSEAREFSADARAYLASSSYAHR